jgi:hypothetical protein
MSTVRDRIASLNSKSNTSSSGPGERADVAEGGNKIAIKDPTEAVEASTVTPAVGKLSIADRINMLKQSGTSNENSKTSPVPSPLKPSTVASLQSKQISLTQRWIVCRIK